MESVQKEFTDDMFLRGNIPFNSYNHRLKKLGIKSLEYRRLEFDIIFVFEIYHSQSDLHLNDYFEHCDTKCNLRSFNFLIRSKFYSNSDQCRNFFLMRIIVVWNSLPYELVSVPNIIIFRHCLKRFNLCDIFLKHSFVLFD